ncbi:hypothetical protein B0H16DRAFT_1318064 [Mycena metata]|uniref:Uncharacterized protein n=1 Tax=Mycena metata TaxID=1033252 RepID=A0AAD7IVP2_9AGAR|nr:hypothetical protein B0H16DRAFT_1318064 [Mycena metata]
MLLVHAEGYDSPDDEEDEFDAPDISTDPLFRSRASLFESFQPGGPAPAEDEDVPWAFDDHPAIRNIYIRAFVGSAFHGMTREATVNMLRCSRVTLQSGAAAGVEFRGLENFAVTLSTVEKRLGLSTDSLITYMFLCDVCWRPHFPHELSELNDEHCDAPDCDGTLYTVKRLSGGAQKRTPVLTLPFVSPDKAIQRMCLQPGKVAQWQEWRRGDDVPGRREPSTSTGYSAFDDPDKPLTDITDGWGWRAIQAGLERRRNGSWDVRDVDVSELKQQFVALPNGIVVQINVDWFQAVKNGCHSTGALYATICNNRRDIRFLREETSLLMVFPGPHEPSSEQYNNVLRIVVHHFKRLYNGQFPLTSFLDKEPELFHVQVASDVYDLPASRKTSGTLACTSKIFMCDRCDTPFYALTDPAAYDSKKFNARDPWRYLKYAFRARDASAEVAEEISRRRGVRYSVVDELVNWLPGDTGLVEPMHCIYGSLIKHLCKNILYKTGMIQGEGMEKLEEFFRTLIWPPSVSRLPPSVSVARGAGSIKADQWRSQIIVFFVGLFAAWQVDGEIPDIDAEPSASNTKNAAAQLAQEKLVRARLRENLLAKKPDVTQEELDAIKEIQMDRSLRRHYDAVVQFTAAIRILTSNSISPNEIKRGCGALERSIQDWARMHCHLVPYFHLATHLQPQFYKHGPLPGWWAFPYERDNGFLGRFNHNGHAGGEMEGTMMRGWWKATLIQDLITRLEKIPNPGPEDIDSLEVLKSCIKGGTSERKGSLLTYISRMQTEANPGTFYLFILISDSDAIEFSRFSKTKNLRELGPNHYRLVLQYLKELWGPDLVVLPDVSMPTADNEISVSAEVESFSHAWVKKRRFGAGEEHRGQSAKYGYINGRVPVRIDHILRVKHKISDTTSLVACFAILRRFQPCTDIFNWPWDLWATGIGVRVWQQNILGSPEVVSLDRLTGHFVLAPITVRKIDLWVTIAYDHASLHYLPALLSLTPIFFRICRRMTSIFARTTRQSDFSLGQLFSVGYMFFSSHLRLFIVRFYSTHITWNTTFPP